LYVFLPLFRTFFFFAVGRRKEAWKSSQRRGRTHLVSYYASRVGRAVF
jgi:hypothetical protein